MTKGFISLDSAERKELPMATGLLDYFPAALAEVARVSKLGNDKHNPGQPLHHARGKSMDHADCIMRHLAGRGGFDGPIRESAALAWRALALLQEELENEGNVLVARAAKLPETQGPDFMLRLERLLDDDKRIAAIKALREFMPAMGLKEAKDVVESVRAGDKPTLLCAAMRDVRVLDAHFDYSVKP